MVSKAQIKEIRLLHLKKHREQHGCFLAEGDKTVCSFLESNMYQVQQIFALAEWIEARRMWLEKQPDVKAEAVSPHVLSQLSHLQTPQQVVALIKLPHRFSLAPQHNNWILALDAIRDPGNLGTIIRIADWFGIEYVCCSPDCADAFQPKVVQASMGSLARVQIVEEALATLFQQHAKIPVLAATLHGKPIQVFPQQAGWHPPAFLLVGNEAHGISPALLRMATAQITIPRVGRAESLNAAVATGILCAFLCLTETARPARDKSAG